MLCYFFRLTKLSQPLNEYSQLEEMLALRKLGWSYTLLADKFSVPKTTIRYLCRRFGLAENAVATTTIRRDSGATRPKPPALYNEKDERINKGKSYAEYLKEEQDRKWRDLMQRKKSPTH